MNSESDSNFRSPEEERQGQQQLLPSQNTLKLYSGDEYAAILEKLMGVEDEKDCVW
jgi:hypothetical protein